MNQLIAWTTDTGTHEMPAYRRGVPFADQPTEPAGFPWTQPDPVVSRYERSSWSAWARALTALIVTDVAGLLYVAVTW